MNDPLTYDDLVLLRNQYRNSSTSWPGELLGFKDRIVAMPVIQGMSVFRGQIRDYGSLRSGLYRDRDPYKQAISLAKQKEFETCLSDVPAFSRMIAQGMPVSAVAQHYGLATEYLDVSGSFDVALFFATCTYDREKKRYRPLNHKEILDNPLGMIYNTLCLAIPYDDLEIIGFSSLNRPSRQHSILIRDRNDNNLDRLFGKWRFEHSVRLSKEMYRLFKNGNALFPGNDSESLETLAVKIRNSMTVNRHLYLESCHKIGLTGTDEELISNAKDFEFTETDLKLSPQDIMRFDHDIERANFIRNSGMQFTERLCYREGRDYNNQDNG